MKGRWRFRALRMSSPWFVLDALPHCMLENAASRFHLPFFCRCYCCCSSSSSSSSWVSKTRVEKQQQQEQKMCVCVYIFICEGFQAGDRITTPAGSIIFTRWLVSGIFILPPYSSPLWPLLVALVALFLGPSLSSSSSSASFPLKPIQLGN